MTMPDYALRSIDGQEIVSLTGDVDYRNNLPSYYIDRFANAKNAMLAETEYSYDKIPFILTTDQHSRLGESQLCGIYRMIAAQLDMQSISKIINLGDVTHDGDRINLERWKAVSEILPTEKQVNIWGNHDFGNVVKPDQGYLKEFFFSGDSRRGGGNGYFAVCDNDYNVKYLCISNMEYVTDGTSHKNTSMSTQQASWIIRELTANDGYDIILCAHWMLTNQGATKPDGTEFVHADEPFLSNATVLDDFLQLISDRRTKKAGTFTDDLGVTHAYDFSGCQTELLCGFFGHDHADLYKYLPESILEIEYDKFYDDNTIYLGYVDRKKRIYKSWKVSTGEKNSILELPL